MATGGTHDEQNDRPRSPCSTLVASCCARRAIEPEFAVGKAPGCVLLEDVNGDGKFDLAVANEQGSSVSVLLADGKGRLLAIARLAISRWPESE